MNRIEQIFINRDCMTKEEAHRQFIELKEEASIIVDNGGTYDDIEELLMDYCLEMDYIHEIL